MILYEVTKIDVEFNLEINELRLFTTRKCGSNLALFFREKKESYL